MFAENEMIISVQSVEQEFSTPVHFVVYDENLRLIAASIIGIEQSVKAICAGIIEKRMTRIGNTRLNALEGRAYRHLTRPIGVGNTVHGMVFARNSVFNDMFEDEADGLPVKPVIFAPDGDISKVLGNFVRKKFHLTDQFINWQDKYFDLIPEEKKSELIVKMNPNYQAVWGDLKVVQIDISKKEIKDIIARNMSTVEEPGNPNSLVLIPPKDTFFGEFNPSMETTKDFVTNPTNLKMLAHKLDEVAPHHDPSQPLHWSIRLMERTPFPIQAHKIQGMANALLSGLKNLMDVGDMGTGKSISMLGTVLVMHETKKERGRKRGTSVLLSAPAITLEKWRVHEILPTLPNHAKVEMIRNTDDALKLLKKIRKGYVPPEDKIEFYIVGLDRAKLGHDPYFSGVWKRVKGTKDVYSDDGRLISEEEWGWHCPDCGERIMVPVEKQRGSTEEEDQETKEELYEPAKFYTFVERGYCPTKEEIAEARKNGELTSNGLPIGAVKKWRTTSTLRKCNTKKDIQRFRPSEENKLIWVEVPKVENLACQTIYWRPALKSRGETRNRPRYNISRILKKTRGWFDLFVQDEVQMTKSESSGRGDAFAQMIKASKKQLFLTGTLTTGMSSSIKEILWRSDPQALIDDGFDDKTGSIAWASRYGVIKEIVNVQEEMGGHHTRQRRRAQQPKEEVGISPQLTANHLLHKAVFTELGDLHLPLVTLNELPIVIQQDKIHAEEYRLFHDTMEKVCKETGNWGPFNPSTLVYANHPELGAKVEFLANDGTITVSAPPLKGGPGNRHAKMRKLIELTKQELAEDRHCIIYTNFSGKYDMNNYIKECLAEEGITSVAILSTNTSSEERFEWLNRQAEKGTQVLITNLSLVEVGLDLMPWPTIFYYEMNWEINKIRQSSRRHWRIGQHRECRTYFLVYDGTTEMKQFKTLMSRRSHALLVEGRLDKSELAEYADDRNALAKDLASCLAGTEIEEKWKKLASKDFDEDLEIVGEAEFKDLIKQRMKELAEETLSLCLPIPEKRQIDKLRKYFNVWINQLGEKAKKQLIVHESRLLDAIRHNRIKGFDFDPEKGLWFDLVGIFGFPFVDDESIIAYIFDSLGIVHDEVRHASKNVVDFPSDNQSSNKNNQLDIFDYGVKIVEIKTKTKKGKNNGEHTSHQLAFDLFA